jgi:hypothetical protein
MASWPGTSLVMKLLMNLAFSARSSAVMAVLPSED